jgi:RNA polymerase sigma-70 factor (ECF subfamily)
LRPGRERIDPARRGGYHAAMPATPEDRVKELLAAGERREAATLALREYGPKILGYLQVMLRDEADAADAFSVFAENLWRGLETWRGEASLRTWAYKLAWNAALNLRDEAWRRRGRRFKPSEASAIADEIRTKTVIKVERQRAHLAELRAELTDEEQTLLVLRVDQGLAWEEIAEVLATPQERPDAAALRKRFERLKERLARLARSRGLVE